MRTKLNPFTKQLQLLSGYEANYVEDRYYQSNFFGPAGAAVALGADIVFLIPWSVWKDHGFKTLTQRVTVAVDQAKMRMGLYKDQNGIFDSPTKDLVVDAGEQTFSGTGAQTYEKVIDQFIKEDQPLWVAVTFSANMTMNAYGTTVYEIKEGNTDATAVRPWNHYRVSRVYQALPSTITPNQATERSANQCPYGIMKAKA